MSIVVEIEAALPLLSAEELRLVETALQRAQEEQRRKARERLGDRLRALGEFQGSLKLNDEKVADWQSAIRDARR